MKPANAPLLLKSECIRLGTALTREDALRLIHTYMDHYNTVRLHSAIGYVAARHARWASY
jgi:transposase InsO family protein